MIVNIDEGSNLFQYLAGFSGAFGIVNYGIAASWTSPFLPYLTSNSSIIPMTNEEGSWLAMSYLMGSPFGAVAAGFMADKLGRKQSILCMAPVVFICNIFIAFIRNIWYLHAMRFIIGITDGASFTIVPMYIGEISSPYIRGLLSSLICLYFIFGTFFINVIGSFWDIYTCALISAAIPAIHFITFIFMPESPYWYLKVGRFEKAKKSLSILRQNSNINKQFEIMKTAVEEDTIGKSSLLDLFTIPSNRKACIICFLISCQHRATAKAPLTFYTKSIFEETGSTISSAVSSISFCFAELIVVIISAYFIIDRFGRKSLTVISVAGCNIMLLAMGSYFLTKDFNSSLLQYLNWLPLTALIVYNIFNSMGIGMTTFVYASELFPASVKANAMTLVELNLILTGLVTGKLFQMMGDYFGTLSYSFLVFTVISTVFLILIIKIAPETRGKTLEEIQLILKGKKL